ncbi:MAG: HAD family hydrolase [Pseudobdellovibrionaceae bacterium]
MKKYFEAVLFDLGNVIVKIHFDRCVQSWARSSGKDPEEISRSFIFDEMYSLHEIADISSQQYHAHVCQLIGSDISYAEFVDGWNSILGEPISETMDLILELKEHYKLYVLSNSNILHRQVWAERYKDSLKHFEQVFCSSQLKLRKPDLKAFEKICLQTGISKERILFIDDLEANVQGARDFGMDSVLFSDPKISTNQIRMILS